MEDQGPGLLQLFVKLLDGRTKTLRFSSSGAYGYEIKQRIFEATRIPGYAQRLISGGYQIADGGVVAQPNAMVHLVLSLPGGKGGFGSLLRGAATKAGQKKTNNFDACRDMSGRRLRHVNAEKRLEEWKAEEEERRLEKIAEDFIKKQAKKGKKGVGDGEAQKYVQKYREESARCVEAVDLAVREACGRVKRKAKAVAKADPGDAKRLKIWMGKRKVGVCDSDGDSSSDESDEEQEKSVVLNSGIQDSNKETDSSSDSVTGARQRGSSSAGSSCESGSEEEKEFSGHHSLGSGGSSSTDDSQKEANSFVKPQTHENKVGSDAASELEAVVVGVKEVCQTQTEESEKPESEPPSTSSSGNVEGIDIKPTDAAEDCKAGMTLGVNVEADVAKNEPEKPFNFDNFNSAADMEALGMERLKSELQAHGLKCGGTLQERAARLFLLKSTPLERIPKKLLAK